MRESQRPKKDLDRLPVWAQEYIYLLEAEVDRKDERISELSSEHPDTNVKINGMYSDPDLDLPSDSQIQFYMGSTTQWRFDDRISVGHVRDRDNRSVLSVQGYRVLTIHPRASNSFYISLGM